MFDKTIGAEPTCHTNYKENKDHLIMPFCYSVVEEVLSFSLAFHRQYQIDDKRTSKNLFAVFVNSNGTCEG
ncbi:uncharacterized protein PHALS_01367 [Plasmopara halstedii]|uniref:Uncharacterized protein n=1 Tax=Plasmopara halstedii TaxID=4781 RepID=A0A0P1ASI4_PLAHL|nr:uncharacterized protein PHALS_01367 [Plasmopara halstedii]CEG45040.1 hypothetical protein PHALS_01367 [Plasmopara halstedii]|eukprot:XP_024581409.1 hypothetical protein PHALS_01367 [Plasmopara halstedii]